VADDRTQAPSKRRRQLARQYGQVAHSPELTAAAGWLVAVFLLGMTGDRLATRLTGLVTGSLTWPVDLTADGAEVVARVRAVVLDLGWPTGAILAGFAAGALAMHQLQVHGLWATSQVVPDPKRLWALASGPGLAARAERAAWSMVKGVILVAAAAWTLRVGWSGLLALGGLEGPALGRAVGQLVINLAWVLAGVLLVLGVADYGLRYRRFEAMLRTTPAEQREDRRVMEGDPAAQSQRRQVARAWRGDSPELLAGASAILCGAAGLTLVLAGGPPPGRVTIRSVVRGQAGLRQRRSAEATKVPLIDAPDLARRLARRPSSSSPVAAELLAELATIWPAATPA
jgi:flagellar biosynthetic protein FlhB